jgi:hypothetical protein
MSTLSTSTDSPVTPTESRIQSQCVVWFKNTYRQQRDLFYQIKNDGLKKKRTAVLDTGMGLTAGIPDTFLAIPTQTHAGLYVEFKTPEGKLSQEQRRVIPQLEAQGYRVEIVRTLEQFQVLVREYLDGNA